MISKIALFSLLLSAIVTTLVDGGQWINSLEYIYPLHFAKLVDGLQMFFFHFLLFLLYLIPVLIYRKKIIDVKYSLKYILGFVLLGIVAFNIAFSVAVNLTGMFMWNMGGLGLMFYLICGNIINLIFTIILSIIYRKNL